MIDIYFNDWHIAMSCSSPTQQYDDLSQKIVVHGNVPEGWSWKALLQYGENLDIIELPLVNGRPEVTLNRENLPFAGAYFIQLQGKKAGATRHTDRIPFRVGVTMSGDAQWPTIPTEFLQLEQRVYAADESVLENKRATETAAAAAAGSRDNAEAQAAAALEYAQGAAQFETDAKTAQQAAENARADAEAAAKASAQSATNAETSEKKAARSENNAATSEKNAAGSQNAAAQSAKDAKASEENAAKSEAAALKAKQDAENLVADADWMDVEVDENGDLIFYHSDSFSGAEFELTEDGDLEVTYT